MKKLFLLSIFIFPAAITTIAQRFDVAEQAGMSFTSNTFQKNGFANQIAVGYHPLRHLEISAFYERNDWSSKNNSFGLSLDFTCRYFFAGLEAKYASIASYTDNSYFGETVRYSDNPALGYGLHVGSKQKIYKRLSLVEQIGYVWVPFTLATETIPAYTALNGVSTSVEYRVPSLEVNYYYARIGLSYRL